MYWLALFVLFVLFPIPVLVIGACMGLWVVFAKTLGGK